MSTMPKYIVSTMIQSANVDNNEPVQVRWYTGDSLAQAIAAMASAAAHHEEVTENTGIPASARYSTLGVTLSIEQEVAATRSTTSCEVCGARHVVGEDCPNYGDGVLHSATPSTVTFDTGTEYHSLSDCVYYDRPKHQLPKWAYGDCAGPRVGLIHGGNWDDHIMCEKHFNNLPSI